MIAVMKPFAALGLSLLACLAVRAHELPKDMPARKPGLWEFVTTGTDGTNQIETRRQYCLDADADRALHRLAILRMELSVIYVGLGCQPARVAADGKTVVGEMACRADAPDDSEAAGKDFRWKLAFESDREVVGEEHGVARGGSMAGDTVMHERQRWIGPCEAGQQPGDGTDFGTRYNGGKPFTEPQPDNIQESVRVLDKMLKEGTAINRRLGPM